MDDVIDSHRRPPGTSRARFRARHRREKHKYIKACSIACKLCHFGGLLRHTRAHVTAVNGSARQKFQCMRGSAKCTLAAQHSVIHTNSTYLYPGSLPRHSSAVLRWRPHHGREGGKSKYEKVSFSRFLGHYTIRTTRAHDAEAMAAFRSRVPVSRSRPPPYADGTSERAPPR